MSPGEWRSQLDGLAARELAPPKSNSVTPLEEAPFHTFLIISSNVFTVGGPKIDPSARVLDGNGEPIPWLYAVGEIVRPGRNRMGPGARCDGMHQTTLRNRSVPARGTRRVESRCARDSWLSAKELAPRGITVNAIALRPIATSFSTPLKGLFPGGPDGRGERCCVRRSS